MGCWRKTECWIEFNFEIFKNKNILQPSSVLFLPFSRPGVTPVHDHDFENLARLEQSTNYYIFDLGDIIIMANDKKRSSKWSQCQVSVIVKYFRSNVLKGFNTIRLSHCLIS